MFYETHKLDIYFVYIIYRRCIWLWKINIDMYRMKILEISLRIFAMARIGRTIFGMIV